MSLLSNRAHALSLLLAISYNYLNHGSPLSDILLLRLAILIESDL